MSLKSESVLHKIGATARARVEADRAQTPLESLIDAWDEKKRRKPHDFKAAFRQPGTHVIAEIKLASPSRGDIAAHLEPLEVARQYLEAGARALSVLTEPLYFKGDIAYLRAIRAAYPEALLLQKDFVVDPYQLYQAALAGADAILIIVALLGEEESQKILIAAGALGLGTLVEVHDASELAIAQRIGADLIGINNRNLKDLSISLDVSRELLSQKRDGDLMICESGIESSEQMREMMGHGASGFLIGTSLMRTGTPGQALGRLLHGAR